MSGIIAQNVGRPSGLIKAASGGGGTWVEIKTLTSDGSDATMDFIDGTDDVVLDDTYTKYLFTWTNIHPETNSVYFTFQGNAAGGSGFDETIQSATYRAYHNEADDDTDLIYYTGADQAQGTAFQRLGITVNNTADNSSCGTLCLFDPSSTVSVKHFIATSQEIIDNTYSMQQFTSGYFNTTSAIDEIQFKWSSGEIQDGKVKLFGIKDS